MSSACSGLSVLDIGCFDETALSKRGTEHWLHGRILLHARHVLGIDNSEKIPVEGIRSGENGVIMRGDACSMGLSSLGEGDHDIVVAGEFIEHIECPLAFFRLLKCEFNGRELMVSTPNGVCFANSLMGLIGREVQHPDHLHNFTFKTLNTMCLRAGFISWEIIPYRFYATEMIMASSGVKKLFVRFVQFSIRMVERMFPLLSFGYIVRARM